MSEIFISYDRTSKPLVMALVADLEDLGHTVWFDDALSGGQDWWDHILGKIRSSDVFLFALAPRAVNSPACTLEFEYADALGKPIIPVLVKKGVPLDLLPEALSRIQHVDFLNSKDRKALAAVSRALTTVTAATPLPDPLPEPPAMPVSYVADLAKRARAAVLSTEAQKLLLTDIETSLDDKAFVKDAREILRELKKRSDLLPDTEKGIAELLRSSRPGPPPVLVFASLILFLGASWLVWDGYFVERRELPLTVNISPEPEDAVIRLTGNGFSGEYSPEMILSEGNYEVEIRAENYYGINEPIELGDTTKFEFDLVQSHFQLEITDTPSTAKISFLDAELTYSPGMMIIEGDYEIEVAAPAFSTRTETISIAGGNLSESLPMEIVLELIPLPEMVRIESGSFTMGSLNGDDDERPIHTVTIDYPFALGATEVTFEQYDIYADANGLDFPNDRGWGRGNQPVINVSWNDIQGYVSWLNEQTGEEYRLPSEAEWEYAARAGSTTEYSWGDEIGVNKANCASCGSEWDEEQTAPVGSFAPNAFGLYNMHGNVWEFVQDCYIASYEETPWAGSAVEVENCSRRVLRGGSWISAPQALRSATRLSYGPFFRYSSYYGFRLAQDL